MCPHSGAVSTPPTRRRVTTSVDLVALATCAFAFFYLHSTLTRDKKHTLTVNGYIETGNPTRVHFEALPAARSFRDPARKACRGQAPTPVAEGRPATLPNSPKGRGGAENNVFAPQLTAVWAAFAACAGGGTETRERATTPATAPPWTGGVPAPTPAAPRGPGGKNLTTASIFGQRTTTPVLEA